MDRTHRVIVHENYMSNDKLHAECLEYKFVNNEIYNFCYDSKSTQTCTIIIDCRK